MKIKTYNIRNLSDRQIEKLRLACRKQHLEETFRKSNLTVTLEAITGSADPIIREYQEKGYKLCHDFCSSLDQHLLLFVKLKA